MSPLDTPSLAPSFDPQALAALGGRYAPRFQALWSMAQSLATHPDNVLQPVAEPHAGDRRFGGSAWRELPYYAFLKQAYLVWSEYLTELASLAQLPPVDRQRLMFATRQYVDAIAPTNFPATKTTSPPRKSTSKYPRDNTSLKS